MHYFFKKLLLRQTQKDNFYDAPIDSYGIDIAVFLYHRWLIFYLFYDRPLEKKYFSYFIDIINMAY